MYNCRQLEDVSSDENVHMVAETLSEVFIRYCHLHLPSLSSVVPELKGPRYMTSWLSFVMSNCEVVTFPLVSWVRSQELDVDIFFYTRREYTSIEKYQRQAPVGQVWCLIVSIPYLYPLSYFHILCFHVEPSPPNTSMHQTSPGIPKWTPPWSPDRFCTTETMGSLS